MIVSNHCIYHHQQCITSEVNLQMVKQVHEHSSHPQHAWVCGCLPDGRMAGKEKGFDLWWEMELTLFCLQQQKKHAMNDQLDSNGGGYWYSVEEIYWVGQLLCLMCPMVPHDFCLSSFTILFRSSYSPLFSTSWVLWSSTSGDTSNFLPED